MRRAAIASIVMTILVVAGGAFVRVTGSGLGCPTWPSCTDGSLGPTAEMGIHGVIEFVNRLLTWVLCATVGLVILVARCQQPPRRDVLTTAWWQFWIVILNAIVGGITVLARLSPYMVAAHFIAAMLLLTVATRTFDLIESRDVTVVTATGRLRLHGMLLFVVAASLILIGTVVTGTGVHAGDSADVHRIPLDWTVMTLVHGTVALVLAVVAVAMILHARSAGARRLTRSAGVLVGLILAQGAIGVLQSLGVQPEMLIVLHLIGSALIWAGVLRIVFETRRIDAGGPWQREARRALTQSSADVDR
ncbi:hypothetical protein CH278_05725 [Rhodococcus sp. 05-2254-5]|uniref:COX15/CtaA family protein n=2 Tax=unclassified Rhodococcus (in: high G+C Gram-positive bacteria) TaxID=192944 RepID=UPI000B9B8799|nr:MULTISPECIES: COX15/CtaA family protein [unclassified Rhodococcus (in: high G+C Gram-positive bacteria)]OZE36397.1 hypothetical protein CH278_05725 [Rhodococcus sp. 05-2254-5]OZE62126.1 hypothetical protein CH269_02755 [Rhodococcus sp. 05-2254-1]